MFAGIAAAIIASLQTGCGRLPASAKVVLMQRLHASKIVEIRDVRHRSINGFDYLGVSGTFEIPGNWEWYHTSVILRKGRSDADWSRAEMFSGITSVGPIIELSDHKFVEHLHPWPTN
ncbi:MAG: hypothetical protein LC642_06900 [Verrucomicrobiaceae bacterium]|nr:hypothetical protein [Verrucomicrobiaceae bacterium]